MKYSIADLAKSIQFLLENVYIFNGGLIRRQVVGIPMGHNWCPPGANIYLYGNEQEFIEQLIQNDQSNIAEVLLYDVC